MFPRLMLTQLLCPEVRPCCRHILLAWPSGICVGGLPLYSNSVTPPPGTPCPLQTAHSLPPALSSYLRSSSLADVPVVFFPDLSPLVCCRPRSPPQAAVPSIGQAGAALGTLAFPAPSRGPPLPGWSPAPRQGPPTTCGPFLPLLHLKESLGVSEHTRRSCAPRPLHVLFLHPGKISSFLPFVSFPLAHG